VEGDYLMEVFLASIQDGGRFLVRIGESVADTFETVSSGSWLQTTPVSAMVYLDQGIQVLRFGVIEEPQFNFDKIVFSVPEATGPTAKPTTELNVSIMPGNRMRVRSPDALQENTIHIFDIRGRLMIQGTIPPGEDYLSDPADPGVYIIRVSGEAGVIAGKIVVPGN
jgi:hypothetical protein